MDERSRAYLRLLVYAALLGIPVAFASVLFQTAVHDVVHFVWDVVPEELGWSEPPAWYVVLVPGLAGVLVAAALRLPGHGGHTPIEGLGLGTLHPRDLLSILTAALAALGLGIVLGPEAPLIALGLGLGAMASGLLRTGAQDTQLLTLAGAFAAVAALFGGPLIAALLFFELTAASGALPAAALGRALLPGFVAAGTGALVFTGVGDWPGLHQTALALPDLPAYGTVRAADLGWCLLIALAVGAVVVGARHLAHGVARYSTAWLEATLVVAGLLVGVLAVGFRAVADRPVDLVLFSGQSTLPDVVAEGSAGVLVVLVVAKGLAYALSLGAGFRGGPVFPAIALGAAIAVAAADVLPGLELTPAVTAGIAAGTAAVARAPFTAVLLASILVGGAAVDVAPIAVVAGVIGWLVAAALPNPEDRAAEQPVEPAPAAV